MTQVVVDTGDFTLDDMIVVMEGAQNEVAQ